MKKHLLFIMLIAGFCCVKSYSQVKYGYAVLYLRCGHEDPGRNRVYYSPIVELDRLNFDQYTSGMDPKIPRYSVRYYTYAIDKWFEISLLNDHGIPINDPEKYERNATCVIFDEKSNSGCNDDKTNAGCFFTDKTKIAAIREIAIAESRSARFGENICEVISLR